jgi:prepilin-type N-terminal cleavage/methylation domain-containing protein
MNTTSRHSRGFSIIECAMSVVIVGVMLVAAINAAWLAEKSKVIAAERARASGLANALLAEIVAMPYNDPSGVNPIGLELNEVLGDRSTFDDIDDFHGYSATPPRDSANDPIPGFDGFTESVVVEYVALGDPDTTAAGDSGLKRITVRISRNGRIIAEAVAIHSHGADAARRQM